MGSSTLQITLADEAATLALGRALARLCAAGDALLLHGGLGAGKTTLARGFIEAFAGVRDAPSPTYTLVQTYSAPDGTELVHADLYRVDHAQELDELGLDEAFEDAVSLIEWPDRLSDRLPDDRLDIRLDPDAEGGRVCALEPHGSWRSRHERLAALL